MRDHPKLRAFGLADPLAVRIYRETRCFPREEIFGLTSHLRRAAGSIASNIVEGSARFSEADYLHFLNPAYGSAREVEYRVGLVSRLGFLAEPAYQELSALSVETSKYAKRSKCLYVNLASCAEPQIPPMRGLRLKSCACPPAKRDGLMFRSSPSSAGEMLSGHSIPIPWPDGRRVQRRRKNFHLTF